MNFKIEPEFENYLPHPSKENDELFEKQLIADGGARDPLIVWAGEDILIDGHRRYKFCLKNNLPYKTEKKDFDSEDAAKLWMILNQASRRNWTEEEETLMMGRAYELQKKQQGGDRKSEKIKGEDSTLISTAKKIGNEFGKKAHQVKRAEKISKAVEKINAMKPKFKEDYISGDHPSNEKIIKAAAVIVDDNPDTFLQAKTILESTDKKKENIAKALGVNQHELICAAAMDAIIRLRQADKQSDYEKADEKDFKLMSDALAKVDEKVFELNKKIGEFYHRKFKEVKSK